MAESHEFLSPVDDKKTPRFTDVSKYPWYSKALALKLGSGDPQGSAAS